MFGHLRHPNFFIINLIFLYYVRFTNSLDSTLQLVHVLFRHGDRTTDTLTLYPNDPHINETYYPYGLGELTLKGKQREFRLGKLLRTRYDKFLGEIYTPDIVEAWSSDRNRTKMSLQLVLAGLFPPSKEQMWETDLNWQPIPFHTNPLTQDMLFFGILCPSYTQYTSEYENSTKIQRQLQQHSEDFKYISEKSGLNAKSYQDMFLLYSCLTTEQEYGLILPEWTKNVYPQPLQDLTIKGYQAETATTEMRRITSGTLLKKIVDNIEAKVDNQMPLKNRKIYLYSGHEFNIAHLLHTLEVFEPHIPPYGSYILFELHKIDNVTGFKIYYQDYSSVQPKLLKLPACDEFCPLKKFVSYVEEYFPEKDACKL
ncbi:venom acid phosphatase Acph-1-like [Zophobas morio]|uniref:venom acid phosphatase Acph-1-like n=1 Tax=Zophobas morio TaxID=2755281 RepID=UPI003082DF64